MTEDRAGSPVEIVLHLPKCAGSTVEVHLLGHLDTAFWSPRKRWRSIPLEFLGRKYDRRPPVPAAEIRAVSGHYIGRSVERLFAGRPIRRSVILREPQALVLSWYNYRIMRYAAQGGTPYPFALHLASLPPDPLLHFLLFHWLEAPWPRMAAMRPAEKLDAVAAALEGFDEIADLAEADRLIAGLSARLAIPDTAERANTSEGLSAITGWTPLRLADLGDEDRAALAARTVLDRALMARLAGREGPDPATAAPFLASEAARPLAEIRRRMARARPA